MANGALIVALRFVVWREGWEALRILLEDCKVARFDASRIRVVVSYGSRSGAAARVWGLPRVFQAAFGLEPLYVVEFIGEKVARLTPRERLDLLLHELAHIPSSFTGGLRPHNHVFSGALASMRKATARCGRLGEVLRLLSRLPRT